jgi:putative two-component system response regulator
MARNGVEMLATGRWIHLIDHLAQDSSDISLVADEQPKRLLVVDDERDIRQFLTRYLKQRGDICVEASNGEDALTHLHAAEFDAVITDCWMPCMGGMDLLCKIKELDEDLAVVMISGNHDPDVALRALRLGADDYIFKPFKLAEVTVGLQRALEKRKLKLQIRAYQKSLEMMVAKRTSQVQHLLYHVIQSLVYTLEAKDPYTDGHSQRVTWLSAQLGKAAGLSHDRLEILQLGAMFHDLGKIGVHESILTKRGSLTAEEYSQIKLHPELGIRILEPLEELKVIFPIVRHHHERFDGQGYPAGLVGRDIPLGSRIVAIADSFDAMSSLRTYTAPLSVSEATIGIREASGTQFDPELVGLFLPITESAQVREALASPMWAKGYRDRDASNLVQ